MPREKRGWSHLKARRHGAMGANFARRMGAIYDAASERGSLVGIRGSRGRPARDGTSPPPPMPPNGRPLTRRPNGIQCRSHVVRRPEHATAQPRRVCTGARARRRRLPARRRRERAAAAEGLGRTPDRARDRRVGRVHGAASRRSTRSRSGRASAATSSRSTSRTARIVKKGDLLFVIDPRPYEAVLAPAKARGRRSARPRLELARNEAARAARAARRATPSPGGGGASASRARDRPRRRSRRRRRRSRRPRSTSSSRG